jgi:hypothetical protein
VLPFSCRQETERWVRQLQEVVLSPIARDVAGERRAALALKTAALIRACRGYLSIGLQAAERADADRERLRAAVLNESVTASVIGDELRQAEQLIHQKTRPAFEEALRAQQAGLQRKFAAALAAELPMWRGNLAEQSRRYEAWLAERLTTELTVLSQSIVPLAVNLVAQAEERLRRVVEAFRDRLGRNIQASIGVDVSPAVWEVARPQVGVVPVAVGQTFMTPWELLWWMLPMWLIGGIFRRHVLGRLSWEVTKNLIRLANDWARVVDAAVASLQSEASVWVDTELTTLDRLLRQQPAEANRFAEALQSLQDEGEVSRAAGS